MAYLLGVQPSPQDSSFFPTWATNGALRYYDKSVHSIYSSLWSRPTVWSNIMSICSSNALGQWSPETGPPFVKHVTMWSDPKCVDHTGKFYLCQYFGDDVVILIENNILGHRFQVLLTMFGGFWDCVHRGTTTSGTPTITSLQCHRSECWQMRANFSGMHS